MHIYSGPSWHLLALLNLKSNPNSLPSLVQSCILSSECGAAEHMNHCPPRQWDLAVQIILIKRNADRICLAFCPKQSVHFNDISYLPTVDAAESYSNYRIGTTSSHNTAVLVGHHQAPKRKVSRGEGEQALLLLLEWLAIIMSPSLCRQ